MKISEEVMLYCSTHTISQVEVAHRHALRRANSLRRLYHDNEGCMSLSDRADRYWVNVFEFENLATELRICLEAMYEDRDQPPFIPD